MIKYGLALLFIALGAVIAVGPHLIFPVCDHGVPTASGMIMPMACHWTAQAEIGVGSLVAFGGVLLLLPFSLSTRCGILLMLVATGVLAALMPLLIGMCKNPSMPCRVGTEPALTVLGYGTSVLAVAGFFLFYSLARKEKRNAQVRELMQHKEME